MREWRLSPSLVISVIALFVALGGGAYAALGPRSVGPVHLKSAAVTERALRADSVTRAKIRSGAVGGSEIRNGSIGARKLKGGLPGTLVAYALVTPEGVIPGESKGITDANVKKMPLSQYCLSRLPKYSTAMVNPSNNGHSAVVANLDLPPVQGKCGDIYPFRKTIAVTTMSSIGSSSLDWSYESFYIYLFR